ncbi:MAG: NHL repeat-containing protein [Minisyncoccota bacterium]
MKTSYAVGILIVVVVLGAAYWHWSPGSSPAAQTTTTQTNQTSSAFLPDATSSAQSISTVPSNGDANPYGVAFVPAGFPSGGTINPGDILVSNWNDTKIQGAGTTIVKIAPTGQQSLFFQGKKGLGLTTALVALKSGFVIVGNLATTDGTGATAKACSLLILDSKGNLLTTLTDPTLIDGPWDMAVNDNGAAVQAFVTNALSGTVIRFDLTFSSTGLTAHKGTVIASGYGHHTDPNAAVVGPTGLFYDTSTDTLFIASTVDNAVYSIPNASKATGTLGVGTLVYRDQQHLHGPLALAQAPNGDLLVTNGDAINSDPTQPSEIVEFTPAGAFVKELSVDPVQGGAFGLAVDVSGSTVRFAAVDDNVPSLLIWTTSSH